MNISIYFSQIIKKIQKINLFVSNPENYKDLNNPFIHVLPQTYVWFEKDDTK
ncbi:MAG: hypothetical protein ACI37R_03785 [Candidatus Avigastranaerophilus sp.]